DPWGTPYRPVFFVDQDTDGFMLNSAGPDKHLDTGDDFSTARITWHYFRPIGESIDKAVRDYHQRTGNFIRDLAMLGEELQPQHIDLDSLRDRWGKPYSFAFKVNGSDLVIYVTTTTPDRLIGETEFQFWKSAIDYFADIRPKIDQALSLRFKATNHFP